MARRSFPTLAGLIIVLAAAPWAQPSSGLEPTATVHVHIVDFAFNPATLGIDTDDLVEWHNHGAFTHTATDNGGSWSTDNVAPGGTVGIVFGSSASYSYHCAIHPSMTATLTVGPPNVPPTVAITAPLEADTVSGTITVTGTAADTDGVVTQVEVRIDGGAWALATGTTSWSFAWDTSYVPNGAHAIEARSFDGSDFSELAIRSVTVSNANQRPLVSIAAPAAGSTVGGVVSISGTASDSEGTLSHVEVQIDSGPWQTATGTSPWALSWDTAPLTDGAHAISARSNDTFLDSAIQSIAVVTENHSPDLELVAIAVQDTAVNRKVIKATFRNLGDEAATEFAVAFEYRGVDGVTRFLGVLEQATLAAGAQRTTSGVTWDTLGKLGQFTLVARADDGDRLEELNESNNELDRTTCVPPQTELTCLIPGIRLFGP